jgi:glycosyltransferase involved in cell wall biosynthesis
MAATQRLKHETPVCFDSQTMKVLITAVAHHCDTPGGSPKIAIDEAVALRNLGHDVWMLAQGPSNLPEHEIADGIHLLRYAPSKVAPWSPARSSAHQKAAFSVLARHLPHVDAIHGHIQLAHLATLQFYGSVVHSSYTIHSPAGMEMAIVWRNEGIGRMITAPVGLWMIGKIERECISRSHVVTALSQYTIDCLRTIYGESYSGVVRLLPGWVDSSRFVPASSRPLIKEQLGWPKEVPILFTLRRLVPRMGLDRLIEASHRLLQRGYRFQLIVGGSGPLHTELKAHAKRRGIDDSIKFLGRISDCELPLAYAACDAFVLPTTELECFGIIALEALSSGRPVLATPVGAIPEIIRKFTSSWLAKSTSAGDIAELLAQFLSGQLPHIEPTQLHDRIRLDYGCDRALIRFIEATVGQSIHASDVSPLQPS